MISIVSRLWSSPTLTSWANQGAQAVRLIILLPLILKQFDEVQVAAWLLFSSLTFFSTIIIEQVALVFSRMISLACGGASDLSPIRPGDPPRGKGAANWHLLERLYSQISSLGILLSMGGVLLTFGVGYFALEKLLSDYSGQSQVWTAFCLLLGGQFILHAFGRYAVALRGLNQVALTNRWQAIFSLLSSASGVVALMLGASIVELAIVVQTFTVLNVVRLRILLFYVVEARFRTYNAWGFYRDIMQWLWTPFWRGLIQVFANRAGLKVAIVILSRHAEPASLAGVLLVVRILETLETMANAPFRSHVPHFGRLVAAGSLDALRGGVTKAMRQSQWMLAIGILVIGFGAEPAIKAADMNVQIMDRTTLLLLGGAFYLVSTIRQTLMISIIGNTVVAVPQLIMAGILSTFASFLLIPHFPEKGFILSALVPVIILVNVKPFIDGCRLLQCSPVLTFQKSILSSMCLLLSGIAVSALLSYS